MSDNTQLVREYLPSLQSALIYCMLYKTYGLVGLVTTDSTVC